MNDRRRIAPVARPDALYIDGAWTRASTGRRIAVADAATATVFMEVAEAGADDIALAVRAAREAFDAGPWTQMTHDERAAFIRAIADRLEGRLADLKSLWIAETGITTTHADRVMPSISDGFRSYAGLADSFPFSEEHASSVGGRALLLREPVGVVAAIIPWNAPVSMIMHKCAPALLAGCTIVLKASPEAPGAACIFAEICDEVGLPRGVVNMVTADRHASDALVRDPLVDKISFTGSTEVGQHIGAVCGSRVARCTLELGGKSAAIVLDDFDIGQAAATIAGGATFLSGQVCAALTRVVVRRDRHDAMVEALRSAFETVRVADPFDPATGMGPVASERQRARIEQYVEGAVAEGATLACGGARPSNGLDGFFVAPTVFGHVSNAMTIAREEVFGPVLSVIPCADEREAVALANDSLYGLNAAVFTASADRALDVARQIRAGSVGHNGSRPDFGIAFGGFKRSGIGREGGAEGLRSFLETKTVVLAP